MDVSQPMKGLTAPSVIGVLASFFALYLAASSPAWAQDCPPWPPQGDGTSPRFDSVTLAPSGREPNLTQGDVSAV
jgi:hypothetical protein